MEEIKEIMADYDNGVTINLLLDGDTTGVLYCLDEEYSGELLVKDENGNLEYLLINLATSELELL